MPNVQFYILIQSWIFFHPNETVKTTYPFNNVEFFAALFEMIHLPENNKQINIVVIGEQSSKKVTDILKLF